MQTRHNSMSSVNTDFYNYFLKAQREGNEVYIGKDIALVVYDDQSIGIQPAPGGRFRCFTAVFLTQNLMDSNTKNMLKEIRKPSNREGINESLTKFLNDLYWRIDEFHEGMSEILIDEYRDL